MDGTAVFQTVLNPGERLHWTGRKQRLVACILGVMYIFITVAIVRTGRIAAPRLPVFLQLELIAWAGMFVVAGVFLGRGIWRLWNAAYAVTNHRLLVAVGADRDNLRTVALEALDPVRIVLLPARQ
jgi:hypothetical protein